MLSSLLAIALAASAYAAPSSAVSTTSPPASQVYINSIVYGGTGCPQGTLSDFISDDRQTYDYLLISEAFANMSPASLLSLINMSHPSVPE